MHRFQNQPLVFEEFISQNFNRIKMKRLVLSYKMGNQCDHLLFINNIIHIGMNYLIQILWSLPDMFINLRSRTILYKLFLKYPFYKLCKTVFVYFFVLSMKCLTNCINVSKYTVNITFYSVNIYKILTELGSLRILLYKIIN